MPQVPLRASVRRMVEFSLRSGDLTGASYAAMQEGGRAHRARQERAEAEAERPVRWQGECEGIQADIQGRVDLLWEAGDAPCVEELKLIGEAAPLPASPLPVHRMQAVCYGFMLCAERGLPGISVRVSYVTVRGEARACFEERLSIQEAKEAFFSTLVPLARWQRMLWEHRERRDASIAALPFPYPAYRPGQRRLAGDVYRAIRDKGRLFAALPTGTGKSAATLFGALKAMGTGETRQVFCLTSRSTAQLSALDAFDRMRAQGLQARALVLTAKEKCCPQPEVRCRPDVCPRARGYYDRELPALLALAGRSVWNARDIAETCEARCLCPFEFSLALAEISDVVICDYNYVFDPMVFLRRTFGRKAPVALLIDEAHGLPARVRDMLSVALDSRDLAALRRETGRLHGRKAPLYAAMSALLHALREADADIPSALLSPLDALIGAMAQGLGAPQAEGFGECFRNLLGFRMALERCGERPQDYRLLTERTPRECRLALLCLEASAHIGEAVRRTDGAVFYSATLSPLPQMRALLGGEAEDALLDLPSPFPPERLLVVRHAVDTRFERREASARAVAQAILAMCAGRTGRYVAYFPSYAYLALVRPLIEEAAPHLALNVQDRGMDEAARAAFLSRMREAQGALLSLCVLGGVFSEGIDLPGEALIGVAVVGVGLPQVNPAQEALRAHCAETLGDGFAFAYRYPGMHKVLQAAGRVIRSERDTGVVLLLDERYRQSAYARLLPPHFRVRDADSAGEIRALMQEFWRSYGIESHEEE